MQSHTVNHGEAHLYVQTHGDKQNPALILLVGLGMQLVDWPADLIHALQENFFVVTLDNRDMGLSSRYGPDYDEAAALACLNSNNYTPPYTLLDMHDDIIAVADHLQLEQFACVGFSMGGMLAQLVAANNPTRVTAMVQICSSGTSSNLGSTEECQRRLMRVSQCTNDHAELSQMMVEDFAYYALPAQLDAETFRDEIGALITRGYTQGGYSRQWLAISQFADRQAILEQIKAPSLIITGLDDPCIHPSHGPSAHSCITDSELLMVPNVGHWLNQEICQAAAKWLKQTLSD